MSKEKKKSCIEIVPLSEEESEECKLLSEMIKVMCTGFRADIANSVLSHLLCHISFQLLDYSKDEFIEYMSLQWHFNIDNENPEYDREKD